MSNPRRSSFRLALAIVLMLCGALGLVAVRFGPNRSQPTAPEIATKSVPATTGGSVSGRKRGHNLSLQPEAFSMIRRLGARFSTSRRGQSILAGRLTIGSERRVVNLTRTQTDDGEQVEINIAGLSKPLTWNGDQGALSATGRATGSDRELIERLVLDSPDQFVLAQLRGASYFTVARNVRPANAEDNYTGPLWNIIRIGDPELDEAKRPESGWRLYYINAETGLIDKIESEVQGQRIVAEISGWTNQNGEKFPTRIIWRRLNQTIMEYRLTEFSHALQ